MSITHALQRSTTDVYRGIGATGMVQHRRSLAHSRRGPALAEANNLIGSPESVGEEIAFLREAGVDHLCALQFPHDTIGEMLEQMEWFTRDVMPAFAKGDPHAAKVADKLGLRK